MALSLIRHRSNGVDIGSELCEKLEELEQRIKEFEMREVKYVERLDAQQRVILDMLDMLKAQQPRVSRVEQAREDPAKKARTIYVALSDEMGGSPSDRTLVAMVSRIAAEYGEQFEARGLVGPNEPPTTSHALALYLSEPMAGPNVWHSAQTRRIHKVLDHLGIKPSQRASA